MPDIGTLFFLVVAVVIFLRLRSVLGQRTGEERSPNEYRDHFGGTNESPSDKNPSSNDDMSGDNVVSLPSRNRGEGANPHADIEKIAPKDSDIHNGLVAIRQKDPNFSPQQFIEGGRMAYEMIVMAFADGDRKTLKNLLARDVYDGFTAALDEREKLGETVKSSFVGIEDIAIVGAEVKDSEALITLKVVSEIISATFDKEENLIDGDENVVAEVKDFWTFARDLRSRDPNWKLVATEAEN